MEKTIITIPIRQALESIFKHRVCLYDWGKANWWFRPVSDNDNIFCCTLSNEDSEAFFWMLRKIIPSQAEQWPTSAGEVIAAEKISRVLVYNKNWNSDQSDKIPKISDYLELMKTQPEFEQIDEKALALWEANRNVPA